MTTVPRLPVRPLIVASSILVAMLVVALPAVGYVIFLKDGNQILTKGAYREKGDQALFELQSGVTSSIPLAEIDVPRTERENRTALRGVQVLEGFEAVDKANALPPPSRPDSISDLLRRTGESGGIRPPERRGTRPPSARPAEGGPPRTAAGYVDLVRLPRRPFGQADVREALVQYFQGQGIETLGVYEGSAAKQPFIEMIAASEAAVFKALEESANALLQVRASHPDQVAALEILMVARADAAARSGQFQLTPELAELLTAGRLAPATFFLRYVEF